MDKKALLAAATRKLERQPTSPAHLDSSPADDADRAAGAIDRTSRVKNKSGGEKSPARRQQRHHFAPRQRGKTRQA